MIRFDKKGRIYFGPRSYDSAMKQIQQGAEPADVAAVMERGGFTGPASRIRREYSVKR